MVALTYVLLGVVAAGQYQLALNGLLGKYGVLVVTDTVSVTVTDAVPGTVQVVDGITQRPLIQMLDVFIQSVQVAYTVAVQESVQDVMDVHPM